MKKVLITGEYGYISTSLAQWLAQWPEQYAVQQISLRGDDWKALDFADTDVLFHGVGIAHGSGIPARQYDQVNRALAVEVAKKAKQEGVGQFILMSSMAVYGATDLVGRKNEIEPHTLPQPQTPYGKSKYAAETEILALRDGGFLVCAIRAPMVYGANCPGNYSRLRRLTLRFGLAPKHDNARSAIYIEHLCAFIRLLIDGTSNINSTSDAGGVFCPQDNDYFHTASVMAAIAEAHGRRLRQSTALGVCIKPLAILLPSLGKAFGNLTYAQAPSTIPSDAYCKYSLHEAIRATEAGWRP